MLILTRKEGEGVKIGDNIYIKVIEAGNGVIKLGFDAPLDTVILRSELENEVKRLNIEATKHHDLELLTDLATKIKK